MHPMPPLFLSHGSPMTALEPREAGAFMAHLGPTLTACFGRPRAVLAMSAHTLARRPALLAAPSHAAVYDFGDFDPRLNRLRYDAPGDPALALQAATLLTDAGVAVDRIDRGGLDHGLWTPLRYMFPAADMPVLPLAFSPHASPAELATLGAALAPLAQDGVLIIGSGSLTHNLRMVFGAPAPAVDAPEIAPARAFRAWVHDRSRARDWDALLDYRSQAPHAALMHPTDEHWLPWYPVMGAGGRDHAPQRMHASLTFGCLAMDAYAFGPHAAALMDALSTEPAAID